MEKSIESKQNQKKINFTLHAPKAGEVFLAGDFNQWDGQKHKMKQSRQGKWEKTLMLTKGIYEYKYMVDGNWQEDPNNHQTRLNAFGTYNNCLTVL